MTLKLKVQTSYFHQRSHLNSYQVYLVEYDAGQTYHFQFKNCVNKCVNMLKPVPDGFFIGPHIFDLKI